MKSNLYSLRGKTLTPKTKHDDAVSLLDSMRRIEQYAAREVKNLLVDSPGLEGDALHYLLHRLREECAIAAEMATVGAGTLLSRGII